MMKSRAIVITLFAVWAACLPAVTISRISIRPFFRAIARAAQANQESAAVSQLPPLPGKGLAQHPFLYCGEWDTRKPVQTIFLVRGGKVMWTYSMPIKNEKGELNEFDDVHMLSNRHILFARKTGATEITMEKKVVWNYDAPPGAEIHSAQPIGRDKVLFMQNGLPAKLILMNKVTGKVEMEHVLQTARPDDPKSVHGQFRHVRLTKAGTYLVPHLNMGKVVEYDKDWKNLVGPGALGMGGRAAQERQHA